MRIRGAKTELEEAGLETDGMAESTSKLREEILALSGVDIMIDDSTFKSTYDIVLELAQVWDTLTDVSQANISELLAGKRGGNVINSLMTNADLLEETYATALGAEGSAERELENYQQGVQYSVDVFKASWEELSNTILSSDLLKGVVDFGSGFLQTINDIISSVGGLQTTLAAVAGIGLFKGLRSGNIQSFLGLGDTKGFTAGFTSGMNGATQAATGLNAIVAKTGMSIGSLVGVSAGIAGIGATIYGVYKYAMRFDDAIEEAQESLAQFQSDQTDLDALESQTDDIKSQLETLADTYEINIDGLDDVDSMIDKIETAAGTTLSITDKATLEDLRAQNTELERQIALQQQVVDTSQAQALADAQKALSMNATADLTTARTHGDIYGFGLEETTYENTDVITATQNEINKLGELKEARRKDVEEAKNASGEKLDSINEEITGYDNEIAMYENAISTQLESLDSIKEALVGTEEYDIINSLQDQFNNIDLSALQRELSSIDSYFNRDGMDSVKNAILDAVAAGENASDVFERMGLSLSDIGSNLDRSDFDQYFSDLVADAEAAEEAINSVEGTVASMTEAADTENQNANWESAASLLADAKELYENGLVGTDDFKTAAQYLTSGVINPDAEGFEFDSDAYVAAWEKAQDKINRYFDADNPIQSMQNALDDLVDSGLATYEGEGLYEWTKGFENTAEAADAFGLSVSATEDILHGLEAYGFEFDQVFFSSEGLTEYETALNSLKSLYESMGEGDSRERLGGLIEGFDEDYAKYEDDISQLDKNAIVHIQFEYDLASIEAEVQTLRDTIANGDASVSNYAQLLGKNQKYINTAKEGTGLNVEGVEVPVQITNIEEEISRLQSDLQNATSDEEKIQIQADISNLQDVEKNLLNAFNDSEYGVEINAESSFDEVESAWDGFLNSVEGQDLIANLNLNDDEAIQVLSEVMGYSGEEIREYITADNSNAISAFADLDTLAEAKNVQVDITGNTEDIRSELLRLSIGNTLVFTADIGGVETALAGVQTMDGEITYIVDTDTDVSEAQQAIASITGQDAGDVRISVAADTSQAVEEISRMNSDAYGDIDVHVGADISEIEEALNSISEETVTVDFEANVDGVEDAVVTRYQNVDGSVVFTAEVGGVETVLQPLVHEDGTITYTAEINGDTEIIIDATDNASGTVQDINSLVNAMNVSPNVNIGCTDGASGVINSVSSSISSLNGKTAHTYVYTHNITTNESQANGTAHAKGTTTLPSLSGRAKASGDVDQWSTWIEDSWRTKKGENALTGELGRELVVDVNNNRWYTVGDDGAEFTYIPAGAVVFNHKQTEELLTTGSTNGTAHAQGTAFANGGRLITSSSKSSSSSSSSSSSKKSSSSSSSSKKSSSSSSKKKSSSSSSSSSSDDFEESLDWIEIEIDRIERAIDRLDLKAESTYNNWTTRNKNLASEISKITEEINVQQKAYDRYIQEANSVGLSSKYVKLVQNGTIDISTITDEDLADQIKEYQKWYEKALDCKDAIDELTESVKELYEEAFQNIIDEFDAILGVYEHEANMLQGYIKQTEAQGYITSTKYYTALIENEQTQLKQLNEERTRLVDALNDAVNNGNIAKYSESWYEMCDAIDKVDEAIQDANTSIIEFNNSIRQIEWDTFDLIQDYVSDITKEADFLIDLMSSRDMYDTDTGEITDYGRATFGLHAVNYNTYMSQADEYAKEIESIDKDLANDPYNQDLIERRRELLELQQESISNAEDEKDAIRDLVEDGINAELSALQDLIDEYTDLLDVEKDMYDYSKKIADQQKNIASLEKQLSAYQGDTSEEGAARRQKLQNELDEAREELEQTQYEQAITETKKLLNDLYDEYEKVLNERLDDIDLLISDVITNVNQDSELIYSVIQEEAESVGYTLSDAMNTTWESQKDVITTYGENFTSSLTGIQTAIDDIKALVQKQVDASNKTATSNVKSSSSSVSSTKTSTSTKASSGSSSSSSSKSSSSSSSGGDGKLAVGDKVTYNSGKYYYDSYGSSPSGSKNKGKSVYVTRIISSPKSGQNYPVHISTGKTLGSGDLGWLKKSQISGYASGTKSVKNDELSEINEKGREIVVSNGNPTLVDLKRGDGVISNKLTENLMEWGEVTPQDVLEHLNPEIKTNKQVDVDKNVEVNIAIDKVEDYNDFIRQLQNDDKAERLIQSICYGEVTGRGRLSKYNVKLD